MSSVQKIGREIARLIDQEVRGCGYEPSEFYRANRFSRKIWRIRSGRGFTFGSVREIIACAETRARV